MNIRLLVFSAVIVPALALADEGTYQCEVRQFFVLDDNGTLRRAQPESGFVGEKFVIDRRTGRITGGVSDNRAAKQVTVLDGGSKTNSFQILTIHRTDEYELLTIKKWDYGINEQKPFVSVSPFFTRVGTCR